MKNQIHQPYTLLLCFITHSLHENQKTIIQPMGAPIATENMQLSLNIRVFFYAGPRVSILALQDTLWDMSTG